MNDDVQSEPVGNQEFIQPVIVNKSRILKKGILWMILMLEIIILAWSLPHDLLVNRRVHSILYPLNPPAMAPDYSAELKKDPIIGWRLRISHGLRKIRGRTNEGYLLVYVGNCASCLHADLKTWGAEAKKDRMSMVLLTSATRSKAREFERSLNISAPIISDTDGELVRRINAFWAGRAYLFSPRWRLMWLSKKPDFPEDPFSRPGFHQVNESGKSK